MASHSPHQSNRHHFGPSITVVPLRWAQLFFCVLLLITTVSSQFTWEQPGCHKVGHTRTIRIPGCVEFQVPTNACRGYCTSFAVPSSADTMDVNPNHWITSIGQCCNIMEAENVKVRIMCKGGPRELIFKSAKTCSCYHCKQN